jgi:hypothetical protein
MTGLNATDDPRVTTAWALDALQRGECGPRVNTRGLTFRRPPARGIAVTQIDPGDETQARAQEGDRDA